MTTTADSARSYVQADGEGRPCQSPVLAAQSQGPAGAVAALATGAAASAEIEMRRDRRLEPVASALRSYAEALRGKAS